MFEYISIFKNNLKKNCEVGFLQHESKFKMQSFTKIVPPFFRHKSIALKGQKEKEKEKQFERKKKCT